MRPRIAATLVALGSLAIPATVGAAILPVQGTTVVQVETGQLGFSTYTRAHLLDGSVRTDVYAPGGRWWVKSTNVTVTPELDGTFTLGWPCPLPLSAETSKWISLTPDGALVVVQAGAGWEFEFTSPLGQHTVVPNGACGARVVGR